MVPARDVAQQALAGLLRGQPLTAAKVRCAWRACVGAAMARATAVEFDEASGALRVAAVDGHWRRETARSAAVIRRRLAGLLGPDTVKRIIVKREVLNDA